ncbi:ATP-binding protein [Dongia sp.]|uniref:cache domain-containing sensor histidine kinase n=1 Tax=Dongia sp. TaxID=1977262 RepID=UPI0035B20DE1
MTAQSEKMRQDARPGWPAIRTARQMPLIWCLVAAIALAAAGIAAALLVADYRAVSAAGNQRAGALANIAAAHVQQTLSAIEVGMQVLDLPPPALDGAAGADATMGQVLARVMRIMPALGNLQVWRADGQPAYQLAAAETELRDAARDRIFAYHRDHPGDDILLDPRERSAGLVISRRISRRDGSFAGIIVGDLDPHYFDRFFAELGADRIALRWADGVGTTVFPRQENARQMPGTGQFVASAQLRRLPLEIDVGLDRRTFLAPWESKRDVGIALTGALIALLIGGTVALRRHTAQAVAMAALESRSRVDAAARSRADEISRRKSDFISQMSHELRTPLNAIIGFSEVIKSASFGPVGQPKYQEYADDIHYSAQHLLSVINNILDLSKVEAGKWHITEDVVAVRDLLESLQRLAGERATRENVRLAFKPAPVNMMIRGDRRTLLQIMLNLTINAIKFAGPDRQVDLDVHALPDGSLAINVADHGDGMNADELEKAMRPFEAPTQGINGCKQDTGLGLPLAAAFAELHGGKVELDSAPGLGTTARLILPAARVETLH